MGKRVYVGNLNYDTSADTLRELSAEHGEVVSVDIVTDRYTGRSRGFGFIEMATEEGAEAVIAALNGKTVDGRELRVAEAKPRRSRGSGDRNRGRSTRW